MDARPRDQARTTSLNKPHLYTPHDPPADDFEAQTSTADGFPLASSSTSSRNSSPSRSEGCTSDDPFAAGCSSVVHEALLALFHKDSSEVRAYYEAPLQAHITKQSLGELDIGSIINNSKLRHDVNFDRELHFRPNMDGERGRRKQNAQYLYWRAIAVELRLVFDLLQAPPVEDAMKPIIIQQCTTRLRKMFETTKEILKNLVPDRDQSDVDEHLDVRMLMQEISRGVCNFVSIAGWIAQLLKRHCAPMRDEMVDRMVEKIQKQTPESITRGLVDLFNVLEAMKLDVANHQIRHLRALLIEDTINFEKKYHFSRMRKNKYNCRAARSWYLKARNSAVLQRVPMVESYPNRDVEGFVHGFFQSLLPTTTRLPDTFTLDSDRIRGIRADFDECIRESICCDVLREILSSKGSTLSTDDEATFRQRLQIITGDVRTSMWQHHAIEDISCEIVRFALQTTGSSATIDAGLEDDASRKLRSRLSALRRARTELVAELTELEDQKRIIKYGQKLHQELFSEVFHTVEEYLSSSPYEIFHALVPPTTSPLLYPTLPTVRPTDRQRDLVQRIAHIAILHWRTWEHLVYNNEDLDGETGDNDSGLASQTSMPGPGQAIPVPALLAQKQFSDPRDDGREPTSEGCSQTKAQA